jgi:threonylcarbamoyladenosine tRNA methylthiotransferase MtaB
MIDHSIFQNKKAAFYTLGCKLNFAETSTIGKQLEEQGIRKIRKGEKADICIINTCSVTELADKKCRQTIRRVIKEHPGAFIIATGCYAQLKPGDVAKIEGVDLVIGSAQKLDIISYLSSLDKKEKGEIITSDWKAIDKFVPSCSKGDRTRYFLKVQDGCDYFCSYCTIPMARGKSRNGSIKELVMQAEEAAQEGAKEIILTGVNIGDFGRTTRESFFDLVMALDQVEGISRYRISSIEPNLLTDEILAFTAQSKRFAPHFHIPLQSGSDDVLKLMRRRYDTTLFRHKIERIKQLMPHAFIGVDVIVGVRGETETFFDDARRFIESLAISQLHVFPYSERPGTRALLIEPNVTPKQKQDRCHTLLNVSDNKLKEFYTSQIGSRRKVLFEQPKPGMMMHGFSENYVRVEVPYVKEFINQTVDVILNDFVESDVPALGCTFITE